TRFDVRAAQVGGVNVANLNLNGHTLTKAGGFQFVVVATNVGDGNIVVNAGTLSLETTTSVPNNNNGTSITYNTGTTAQFFESVANTLAITRPMVVNGVVTFGNNSNVAANVDSNI